MKKLNFIQLILLIMISILLLPLVLFLGICFIIYGFIVKKRIQDTLKKSQQDNISEEPSSENRQKGRVIEHE